MKRILQGTALLATLSLVGCVDNLSEVKKFGTATTDLSAAATSAYTLIDEATVEQKLYDAASDPSVVPTDATFTTLFEAATAASPTGDDALAARLNLLDKLSNYSAALTELATYDARADIDKAATDLHAALSGLNDSYAKASGKAKVLTDENLAVIATAVDAIGGALVEVKRFNAIRKVIIEADPAVQRACDLLATELDVKGPLATDVFNNLRQVEGSMKIAYDDAAKKQGSTFEARLAALQRIREAHQAAYGSQAYFAKVASGVKQVGAAHHALQEEAASNHLTSAKIVLTTSKLIDYVQSVRDYYETLKKKKEG